MMKRNFRNSFSWVLVLSLMACFGGSNNSETTTIPSTGSKIRSAPVQGAIPFCSASASPLMSIDTEIIFYQYATPTTIELFMIMEDGTGKTQITNHGVLTLRPRKTPNNRVIGISNMDGDFDVYIWEFSGDLPCRITNNTSLDGSPSINTSNRAFYNGILNSINGIDRDGSNHLLLIGDKSTNNGSPAACGSKVAYTSNISGSNQVYIMDTDGTNRTKLTNESGGVLSGLNCCPDGSKIVYSSSGGYVKTVDTGTSVVTQITTGKEGDFNPTCDEIVFIRSGELYKTTLAGVVTQLTSDGKQKGGPSWSY